MIYYTFLIELSLLESRPWDQKVVCVEFNNLIRRNACLDAITTLALEVHYISVGGI